MKVWKIIMAGALSLCLTACPSLLLVLSTIYLLNSRSAINRHENDQDGGNAVMLNIKNDIGDMSQIVTREGWTYTFHGNDHPPEAVDAAVFL